MRNEYLFVITSVLTFILFSTIIVQAIDYPTVLKPLPNDVLKNLITEFNSLNDNIICNSLDKYGFVLAGVCQANPIIRKEITNKDLIIENAKETLVKNSKFTGVSNKEDLVVTGYDFLEGCVKCDGLADDLKDITLKIFFKNQVYQGIDVEDTYINVFADAEKVYRIDEHWYQDIKLPDTTISEDDAKSKLIGKELAYTTYIGELVIYTITQEDLTNPGKKVILPTESGENIELPLAWKIPVGKDSSWSIYLDAVTGNELKTQQNFNTANPPANPSTNKKLNNSALYWIIGIIIVLVLIVSIMLLLRKKK